MSGKKSRNPKRSVDASPQFFATSADRLTSAVWAAITMDRGCPLSFAILQQHNAHFRQPWRGAEWAQTALGLQAVVRSREGIEPPTRGFSARCRGFRGFINQSLAASCRPLPRHTKAQSWHSQSELVTFLARDKRNSYSGQWRSPLTGDESVRAADRLSLNLLGSPPLKSPAQRVSPVSTPNESVATVSNRESNLVR
jgi:hypothetical protein